GDVYKRQRLMGVSPPDPSVPFSVLFFVLFLLLLIYFLIHNSVQGWTLLKGNLPKIPSSTWEQRETKGKREEKREMIQTPEPTRPSHIS
ncbi:hypothetical protein, partial [Sphingobacterium daejeonense]|uniref:hypothetical protein n=1 Tax=Sphingobacterium daejeonense TaxID=371142 RepID=UPI003D30F173